MKSAPGVTDHLKTLVGSFLDSATSVTRLAILYWTWWQINLQI